MHVDSLHPDDVAGAVAAILRDGFAVLHDALDDRRLARARAGAERVIAEQTAAIAGADANRGFNRYSFGDQLHHPEWAELVDSGPVLRVLEALWGGDDFTCSAAGGDFSLPGAGMQHLHSDLGEVLNDPLGVVTTHDLPPPYVVANYPMVDFTELNGPTRFVPRTQRSRAPIPSIEDEPEWMRRCTVPVRAGSVVLRDVRCWHGGTPNRSNAPRAMIGVGYKAPWFRAREAEVVPGDVYASMSSRAQQLCRLLVAPASRAD